MKPSISAETLRSLVHYNVETGEFTWLARPGDKNKGWNKRYAGKKIGNDTVGGYLEIQIRVAGCKCHYRSNRLAWLYVHGSLSDDFFVDHINKKRQDNRISNLRLATCAQNSHNHEGYKNTSSGIKGVTWSTEKKIWCTQIIVSNKRYRLGKYKLLGDAAHAYAVASATLAGEFSIHSNPYSFSGYGVS